MPLLRVARASTIQPDQAIPMQLFAATLAALLLLPGVPASAQNVGFLKDSVLSRFNKDDIAMFDQALRKALEEGKDGVPVVWKNDKTGSGGTITPSPDPKARKDCRTATVVNYHRSSRGETTYAVCRQGDRWLVSDR
jgi:surface antigen